MQQQWFYRDHRGDLLARVTRHESKNGKRYFIQSFVDGNWINKHPQSEKGKSLYKLDVLKRKPDAVVMLCEGEKAADAAQSAFPDFIATTSIGGSNGARVADWSPLRGRTVYIFPDNDDAGHKYAQSAAKCLEPFARETYLIDLQVVQTLIGTKEKSWDIADANQCEITVLRKIFSEMLNLHQQGGSEVDDG